MMHIRLLQRRSKHEFQHMPPLYWENRQSMNEVGQNG
jgi:hypothetical protein